MRRWRLRGHRPGAALFAGAILVPCVVLGGAGLYLVRQERELAVKRIEDGRRRAVEQAAAALHARLEQIKLREMRNWNSSHPSGDPAVVDNSHVVLPWETDQERGGEFALAVEQGEREEFASGRPAAAVEAYRRALGLAQSGCWPFSPPWRTAACSATTGQ